MNIGFDAKRAFHNFTGLGNYSRFIIEALQENFPDNQYFLYTPSLKSKEETRQIEKLDIITPPKGYSKIKSIWRSLFLFKTAKNQSLDIYHGLSNELPAYSGENIKKIVTIHDLIFLRFPELYPYIDRQLYKWKFKKACKKADVVIAISEQTRDDIIKFFDINPDKIKVVYQGHHKIFDTTYSLEELHSIKQRYQLPEKYILNVGTIEERKNVMHLLKALTCVKNKRPVVLVGKPTPYLGRLLSFAQKNDIELIVLDKIDFKDLPGIYQASDLFVYPSIFEGFGIPIIEAQKSSVPVITSTGSCFAEAGGEGAVYVSPENESELSKAIDNVLSNNELKSELIKKGRSNLTRFTKKTIAADLMDIYRSV